MTEKSGILKNLRQPATIKWLITVLIPLCILLLPSTEKFTFSMKLFFVITIFFILALAFELVVLIIPAIGLPICYVVFNLAPPVTVFQPWTTQIPSLLIGAFIISAVMESTGLSKRIAYWCLAKTGNSFKGLFIGSLLGGLILGVMMPGAVGRTVLFGTIMLGICKALNYEEGSKKATALMLLAFISSNVVTHCIFTSNSAYLLLAGFLEPYGLQMNVVNWLKINSFPTLVAVVVNVALILILFVRKDDQQPDRSQAYLRQEYAALGPISKQEKILTVIIMIALVFFMTVSLHKIQPGYILALAGLICFWPRIALAGADTLKKINFTMVFLTVGMISIGNVSTYIGAGELIATSILPYMPQNITLAALLIYAVAFVGNLLLTPLALISGLMTPIMELGIQLGINPIGTNFIFSACLDNIILPHETTTALIIYGFGLIKMKDFIKFFAIRSLLFIPILAFLYLPWYNFLGFL